MNYKNTSYKIVTVETNQKTQLSISVQRTFVWVDFIHVGEDLNSIKGLNDIDLIYLSLMVNSTQGNMSIAKSEMSPTFMIAIDINNHEEIINSILESQGGLIRTLMMLLLVKILNELNLTRDEEFEIARHSIYDKEYPNKKYIIKLLEFIINNIKNE